VIDEVAPNGVMNAAKERNLELCADTISRSYQDRLAQLRKGAIKHSTESADLGKRLRIEGLFSEQLDPISGARGGIDINTGIRI